MALDDSWVTQSNPVDSNWASVAWSPELSLFCAVAQSGTGDRIMTSPDGINWTARTTPADNNWVNVVWSSELSLFCAVAYVSTSPLEKVMTSPDGINWTIRNAASDDSWRGLAWSPDLALFCAVSYSGTNRAMTSPDGINWTARTTPGANNWWNVAWSPELSLFCVVSDSGANDRAMTSPDGINWTARTTPGANNWRGLAWSPELSLFCAVSTTGTNNRAMTSPDGINWTTRTTPVDNSWLRVTWSPELSLFCAVSSSGSGTNNRAMTSPDGINWTIRTTPVDNSWHGVAWSPELSLFCAVSSSGTGDKVMTWDFDIPEHLLTEYPLTGDHIPNTSFFFGASTGVASVTVQAIVYEAGTLSVVVENDVIVGTGVQSVTIQNAVYAEAVVTVTVENDIVVDIADISVVIENDVVVGIGVIKADITSEIYETAALSLTIENDIIIASGVVSASVENEVYFVGDIVTQITFNIFLIGAASVSFEQELISTAEPINLLVRQNVFSTETVVVNVQQDITELTYSASVSVEAEVTAVATIRLGLHQSIYGTSSGVETTPAGTVIPAGLTNPVSSSSFWTARVLLDGDDVSANLTGTLSVDNEEDAAAVCQFTLKPTLGLVDLTKWVGASVRVFFVKTDKDKNTLTEFLLFNGFVDVPTYDPQSRLTTFTCTDDLQKAFEASTLEQIDAVVGGFWSADVFNEDADKWTYAQDRLSTIPYTMNYDVNRVIVKTPWAAKATPDFTVNAAVVFDESLSVELGNSRGMVNQVDIAFDYQYDTFKEVSKSYYWTMRPGVAQASTVYGITPVTNQMVLDAAESDDWVLNDAPHFQPWPPSGWYDGVAVVNADRNLVVGSSFRLSRRFSQYINEVTTHRLKAPKSIASLGKLLVTEEYNLVAEYSEEVGEFGGTVPKYGSYEAELNTFFADEITDNEPVNPSYVGTVNVPFSFSEYKNTYDSTLVNGVKVYDFSASITLNDRDTLNATVEVVQNLHKSVILKSHRGNSVGFTSLIEPTLTREHTVRVDTPNVVAQGKVRQVTHTLDINAGSALSQVTLGVSRSTAVGITDVETPLDNVIPEPVEEEVVTDAYAPMFLGNWIEADQYAVKSGSGMEAFYSETRFLVPTPGVDQESLDEVTLTSEKEFIIDIPDEELTLNA